MNPSSARFTVGLVGKAGVNRAQLNERAKQLGLRNLPVALADGFGPIRVPQTPLDGSKCSRIG